MTAIKMISCTWIWTTGGSVGTFQRGLKRRRFWKKDISKQIHNHFQHLGQDYSIHFKFALCSKKIVYVGTVPVTKKSSPLSKTIPHGWPDACELVVLGLKSEVWTVDTDRFSTSSCRMANNFSMYILKALVAFQKAPFWVHPVCKI